MYKCLAKDYPGFQPPPKNGGLLTPWADRGVLLLNTCLTVRAHEANSHANKGWERFTQKVIDTVCRVRTRGVVFLAWGTPAQKRCVKINKMRHCVLSSVHPSPLSASRGFVRAESFTRIKSPFPSSLPHLRNIFHCTYNLPLPSLTIDHSVRLWPFPQDKQLASRTVRRGGNHRLESQR
jgi:uracil-DNA glycosylase